jgi:phospholipid/cholesterol/gamma-HCH transport system substrate-binding protein
MSDVQAFTAELRERKSIVADLQRTAQDADKTVVQMRGLVASANGLVNGDGKRTFAKLADAATEIESAAKGVHGMIDKLKGPTGDFAANGLPQMTAAIGNLQRATEHMDQAISDLRNDPRGILGKPPSKEIEVKP